MAATTGHSINTEPNGENTGIYSSLKLLHWLNLNCASYQNKKRIFCRGQFNEHSCTVWL
jgi:hypothetical protein